MTTTRPFPGRDFLLLWQGQMVSHVGNQAFLVASMTWLLDVHRSPGLMGLVLMAATAPAVVAGPFAGVFVDRHSRRAIIVGADLLRGVGHLALGLAMLGWASPSTTVAAMVVLAAASGLCGALVGPALAAAIPDVVPGEHLGRANSLQQLTTQGSVLTGQALGGVACAAFGPAALVLFDAATFVVSAGCARLAHLPPGPLPATEEGASLGARSRTWLNDALSGLKWLRRQRALWRVAVAFAAVNFLFMPVFVLLPVYARDVLAGGPTWYGLLLAAAGAGGLIGAGGGSFVRIEVLAVGRSIAVIGAGTTLLGLAPGRVPALVLLAAVGAASTLANVVVMTLLQRETPAELRGRVIAAVVAVAGAAAPFGLALGGVLGEIGRGRVEVVMGTCGLAILTLAAALSRRVDGSKDGLPPPVPGEGQQRHGLARS